MSLSMCQTIDIPGERNSTASDAIPLIVTIETAVDVINDSMAAKSYTEVYSESPVFRVESGSNSVIGEDYLSSASLELLWKMFSWLNYSLYSNDELFQSFSSLRRGLTAVFYPFIVPLLNLSFEMFPDRKNYQNDPIDDLVGSETDAISEYSDYDNFRLNPRCASPLDEDVTNIPSLVTKSISRIHTDDCVYDANGSTPSSTGGKFDHPTSIEWIITQVDVAQMAKKASHHFHVQSILNLPTIKFKKNVHKEKLDDVHGWSWIAVSKDSDNSYFFEESNKFVDDSELICIVCLQKFEEGDEIRLLPCSHCFHTGCIDICLSRTLTQNTSNGPVGCSICQHIVSRDDGQCETDGSVPSWAFTRIGRAL